jgi:glycosyltransferase involved in cell wall biosynthesis
MTAIERHQPRSLAVLMWGDLFEDFHDTIDVSLERFRTELTGGWLFGYVDALATVGVRTTLIHVSDRITDPERFVHTPTGAAVSILPAPRRHRWLRALHRRFRTRKSLSSIASYGSVPLGRLFRELRRVRADAILTQEYEHARFDVFVLLGRLARLPVFASFQGGDAPHSRLERIVRPFAVRASAGLIVGSTRERERVIETYRVPAHRVAAIPNAMEMPTLEDASREVARASLGIPPTTCVIEWHGRVTIRRKGLDVLIDAWNRVCHERPGTDLLLLLVGTGPDAEKLHQMIAEKGVASIRWRDEYISDRRRLQPYQAAADVFVLPSRHEGFPVAPIEAMALGVPVVAADAPGVADILPEGEGSGGIVVPREDAEALAAALGRLIDDEVVRAGLGRRARARVEQVYSLDVVGRQLASFFFARGSRPARASRAWYGVSQQRRG